ncbi:MAG: glycyl-radical enzyme activating protein [Eubacteriales bacterium]
MSEIKGLVFNIERHALHDGPGIRTLVFLKGCPLKCRWCSNPEGLKHKIQLMYDQRKCMNCLSCTKVCTAAAISLDNDKLVFNRELCTCCGACIDACMRDAIRLTGQYMTADEVLGIVLRDEVFYKASGGGVTVSGGEPLWQIDFLEEFLIKCVLNGVETAIETTGYSSWENIRRIVGLTNVFLYDLKHVDLRKHSEYTGVSNELILENLKKLSSMGKRIFIRIPLIPGFNSGIDDSTAITEFISQLKQYEKVQLLPYHQLGIPKYRELDMEYPMEGITQMDANVADECLNVFLKAGIKAEIEI